MDHIKVEAERIWNGKLLNACAMNVFTKEAKGYRLGENFYTRPGRITFSRFVLVQTLRKRLGIPWIGIHWRKRGQMYVFK